MKKKQKSFHKDNIEKALKAAFLLKLKEKFHFCMFDFFPFRVFFQTEPEFSVCIVFRVFHVFFLLKI